MRCAPMVIDMLNMRQHMDLQKESFGGYSEQIADYTEKGLQNQQDSPRGGSLRAIVDPYSYRGQLPQPKLVILGTNDRYWPVDAVNLYWDDLEGEKYILYVPNNGHGIRDYPRVLGSVFALYEHVAEQEADAAAGLEVHRSGRHIAAGAFIRHQTQSVIAWTANAKTRDFREATWTSQPAQTDQQNGKSFVVDLKKPADWLRRRVRRSPVQRAGDAVLSLDEPARRPAVTAATGLGRQLIGVRASARHELLARSTTKLQLLILPILVHRPGFASVEVVISTHRRSFLTLVASEIRLP